MNDDELLRYSRQIMLPQFGIEGQQRLSNAKVLIIGIGGLGSPVAMYLAAAGVGHLTLVDFDDVDLTNLQRQIIHTTASIGQTKTDSAKQMLSSINPQVTIATINQKLDDDQLAKATAEADLVLDCCDNFTTRFAINRACLATRTPLISGAAVRFEGQLAVFRCDDANAPCYHCLYQDNGEPEMTCADNGILAPVVGVIGCLQATEALKIIAHIGEPLEGKLMVFDAMTMEWRTLKLRKDPNCPACSG